MESSVTNPMSWRCPECGYHLRSWRVPEGMHRKPNRAFCPVLLEPMIHIRVKPQSTKTYTQVS